MGTPYTFGGYAYEAASAGASGSIITDAPRSLSSRLRVADAPGSVSQYTEGGLPGARRFTLSGVLFANGTDDLDDLWDAFVAAHVPSSPKPLYLWQDDRFIMAEVESLRDVNAKDTLGSVAWELGFLCQRPVWLSDTQHTVNATISGDHLSATAALAVGGTAPTRAYISITLSAIGSVTGGATYPSTSSAITITNTATGAAPVVWARSTTGALIVDCATETVTQNGVDAGAALLSGPWLDLTPGVTNTFTFACAGGAQISAASLTWRDSIW